MHSSHCRAGLSADCRRITKVLYRTHLPHLYLLPHGVEIALHRVDADRNAVDERERLRVFGEHRGEQPETMFPDSRPVNIRFPETDSWRVIDWL